MLHLRYTLWLCVLAAVLLAGTLDAQEVIPITIGETDTATLSGDGFTIYTLTAEGGEVITITVRSLHELGADEPEYVRDTVVDVLNPRGKRITYNNDHRTDHADLLPSDSVIARLLLDEPGDYQIRVNTYGGISTTEFEITVSAADLYDAIIRVDDGSTTITAALPRYGIYRYDFEASAGDILTLTARDLTHTLDPIIRLLDSEGNTIAMNDDHGTDDLGLDVLDSRISAFVIPADGVYSVTVSDFLGRVGRFELRIAHDS